MNFVYDAEDLYEEATFSHKYWISTLHVIMVPGVGQICGFLLTPPSGQPKMRLSNSDIWKW